MIRLHIKDSKGKLDREWFKARWEETPWVVRQNLYISLENEENTWLLTFGVPIMEMTLSHMKKEADKKEMSLQTVTIHTDFINNIRHELSSEDLRIEKIDYDVPAPTSPVLKKLKRLGKLGKMNSFFKRIK